MTPRSTHPTASPSPAPSAEPEPSATSLPPLKASSEQRQPAQLRIIIRQTGDPDVDKRRLQRLHGLLIGYPGQDTFTFILSNGERRVEVTFPNNTTHYCDLLREEIVQIVGGMDAIEVIQS